MASLPHMKRSTRRAEVYARSEVEAILTAPRQKRDRGALDDGLWLRAANFGGHTAQDHRHRQPRMQLRVRNGKGAKVSRCSLLVEFALATLKIALNGWNPIFLLPFISGIWCC